MFKRSLVVVDASPRSATRLGLALALARRHGGELTALYAVLPSVLAIPWTSAEGMAGAAGLMAEIDEEQRKRARAVFDRLGEPARVRWMEGGEMPYHALLHQAFVHDLLVLGQADEADSRTGALPPDLLPGLVIDSGRPALVVPAAGAFENTDGAVLVGWKATREAARALRAALPWLRAAPQVHLALADDAEAGGPPLQELEHWLRLQGVEAPLQAHRLSAHDDAGEQLLSRAADLGAALLVMGCYGHGRLRERVLGGATRTVLRSMTLPVLMVH